MAAILMMAAKLLNLGLLQKRDYDVIISVHGVTNNILSRDSNYTNSYVCKSYMGKTGRGGLFAPIPLVILKRINNSKP